MNRLCFKEAVVLCGEVAWLFRDRYHLGQACTKRVSAGNDNTVVDTELQEGVTNSVDLGQKYFVWNRHLTGLVATLLHFRDLVFDLDRTGARFDHLLGQQVGGFFITKTSVDIGDNRHHMCLKLINLFEQGCYVTAIFAGVIQGRKYALQFYRICLLQERVDF